MVGPAVGVGAERPGEVPPEVALRSAEGIMTQLVIYSNKKDEIKLLTHIRHTNIKG